MITLHTSNKLKILSDTFLTKIIKNSTSIFDKDIVVVQSQMMKEWLSLEIAKKFGICANINFLFPNDFFLYVSKFFTQKNEQSIPTIDVMTWQIMRLLQNFIELKREEFKPVKNYINLKDSASFKKSYQISRELAKLFDRYTIFRTDIIEDWENGKSTNFQAILWRSLIEENKNSILTLFHKIKKNSIIKNNMPQQATIFGLSYLPPFYMNFFDTISKFMNIDFFLLKPSCHYWGDFVSKAEKKRILTNKQHSERLHIEEKNRILESMGRQARDFFETILEFNWVEKENYIENSDNNLLSKIQNDILHLREREEKEKILDNSIQIHSVHNIVREVEVLYDFILSAIEENKNLKTSDIIVVAQDIETYIPYIEFVFSNSKIPFFDKEIEKKSHIIEVFLNLLDITTTRFESNKVLYFIESVKKNFSFKDEDIELIKLWIEELNIRWGFDAESKKDISLPATRENTWSYGIDRLLLGYFMKSEQDKTFLDILPFDNVEGNKSIVLGNFIEFLTKLSNLNKSLKISRDLKKWQIFLNSIFDDFIFDKNTEETKIIKSIINNLEREFNASNFTDKIDISVIKTHIKDKINNVDLSRGFLRNGITFSSMLKSRSIPFKVVCLLGMDSSYPRVEKKLNFDLMTKKYRKGDKSKVFDDAHLFLEALLSAEEKFYVSYVGYSEKDNSPKAPSIFVTDMLNYIRKNFTGISNLEVFHKLHAFSPSYFDGTNENLFSYSSENRELAESLFSYSNKKSELTENFLKGKLQEADNFDLPQSFKELSIKDFCSFFKHPAKYFIEKRLDIYFKERIETDVLDKEPFKIEAGLDKYLINKSALSYKKNKKSFQSFYNTKKNEGVLPHTKIGKIEALKSFKQATSLFKKAEKFSTMENEKEIEIAISINDFQVSGKIGSIFDKKCIIFKSGKIKIKDKLEACILNLFLSTQKNIITETILIGIDATLIFPNFEEEAEEILKTLIKKYEEGLKAPLHFFPEFSNQYFKSRKKEEKFIGLQSNWFKEDKFNPFSENQNIYNKVAFKNQNPIDEEFIKNSNDIFALFF